MTFSSPCQDQVATISACIADSFVLLASPRMHTIRSALCMGSHASCLAPSRLEDARYAVDAALLSALARDDAELQTVFRACLADDHLRLNDRIPSVSCESSPPAAERLARGGYLKSDKAGGRGRTADIVLKGLGIAAMESLRVPFSQSRGEQWGKIKLRSFMEQTKIERQA